MAKSVYKSTDAKKSTRKPRGECRGAQRSARMQGCEDPSGNVELQSQGRNATMQKGAWECQGVEEQHGNAMGQKAMRKGRAAVKCEVAMVQKAVQECRRQGWRDAGMEGWKKQCKTGEIQAAMQKCRCKTQRETAEMHESMQECRGARSNARVQGGKNQGKKVDMQEFKGARIQRCKDTRMHS